MCCCVCSAIFYLFKTAPDSISLRRELISSTRYMLAGPYKATCFLNVINDVLTEGVLLGSHLASMETLKNLAVRMHPTRRTEGPGFKPHVRRKTDAEEHHVAVA